MGAPGRQPMPTSYNHTYKIMIYDEDGYVDCGDLSQEQQEEFEDKLLTTVREGSVLEPIQCPVHGMRIDWAKGRVILSINMDGPSITTTPPCSKKNLAEYVNMQAIDADDYVLELK